MEITSETIWQKCRIPVISKFRVQNWKCGDSAEKGQEFWSVITYLSQKNNNNKPVMSVMIKLEGVKIQIPASEKYGEIRTFSIYIWARFTLY